MVTKVSKVVKKDDKPDEASNKCTKKISDDEKDQNFFKKPQMVSNETNITDNMDMQEMLRMIERTFQEKLKNNWDKKYEEEKILRILATKYPTRSFSDFRSGKDMLMYMKCQEEKEKCITYQEMMIEEKKKLILLRNKLCSLLKEKPANFEEVKFVDAAEKQYEATMRYQDIKVQLIQAKIDEHSQNGEEWSLMIATKRKELQKEKQLIKQQLQNLEKVKLEELHTHEDECAVDLNLKENLPQ